MTDAQLTNQSNRHPFVTDALLVEAVRKGLLTPPALTGGEPPPGMAVMRFEELMTELQRDRARKRKEIARKAARSRWGV
jgi:hypothetical protein